MSNSVQIVKFAPLTLYKNTEDDTYATLNWSMRMGYPRITVYTNNKKGVKSDLDYNTIITAPFDSVTVGVVVDYLKEIAESTEPSRQVVDCFNVKYVNGEKTDEIVLQASVIVGKDAEGVNYISAIAEGKKKVKFEIMPNSKWFKFRDKNGDEITDKKIISNRYTKAYANLLGTLISKNTVVTSTAVTTKTTKATSTDSFVDSL